MKATSWSLLALAIAAAAGNVAYADQSEAKGFIEGSSATLTLRNGYIKRDYKNSSRHEVKDQSRWGQAFIGQYESGYTQGTVGFGLDAIALYSVRLDKGKSKNDGGIAFFGVNSKGNPLNDIGKAGAVAKAQLSNTNVKYGSQIVSLPVAASQTSRLLPQTFTGTLLTSQELKGLTVSVGRFNELSGANYSARDSMHLDRLDVYGAKYAFNQDITASLYYAENKNVARKAYGSFAYNIPMADADSLNFNLQLYRTHYSNKFTTSSGDGLTGGHNTIWSLASTYTMGHNTFMLAYQHSSGSRAYQYNIGDGGSAYWLTNSYYSDFNGKGERSLQLSYEYDFAGLGVPGLTFQTAYVHGNNIDASFYDSTRSGHGKEHEFFNEVEYVVQHGIAKDLSMKLRTSVLRANNTHGYINNTNEIRAFVTMPIKLL